MNLDGLAHLLTIITLTCGFSLGRDAIEWRPNRAEVVELVALDDGTALVTQQGDAGSFLSRVRPDGSRVWIARVPGEVEGSSLATNDHQIAVSYRNGDTYDVAVFTAEGRLRWQRHLGARLPAKTVVFTDDTVFVWAIGDAGFRVSSLAIADGALRWEHDSMYVSAASWVGRGRIVIPRNMGGEYVFFTVTRQMAELDGCALDERYLTLITNLEQDTVVDIDQTVVDLDFGSVRSRGSKLIGCGTYRGQTAVLIERTGEPAETRLVLADRSGHITAEHVLPPVEDMDEEAAAGIQTHRLAFAGELPRVIPLVAISGTEHSPILVDLETGKVSGTTSAKPSHMHTFRDGAEAYLSVDFDNRLFHYRDDKRGFEAAAVLPMGANPADHVGGGYIWTFQNGSGRLDRPAITATPALPRRV